MTAKFSTSIGSTAFSAHAKTREHVPPKAWAKHGVLTSFDAALCSAVAALVDSIEHAVREAVRSELKAALHETPQKDTGKLALTVDDVSDRTGLSKSFLRQRIATGELPSVKVGNRRLILPEHADAFLKGQKRQTRSAADGA